jgi:putative alpha-1,2-mannosidase
MLEIVTTGGAAHEYLQTIHWNGRGLNQCSIPWTELVQGGRLELSVGEKPRTDWTGN